MLHFVDGLLHRWTMLAVIAAIGLLIFLHVRLDAGKKEVEFGAALISAVGIVYTILLTVQSNRATVASKFAERWNNVDFTEKRKDIGEAMRGEKGLEAVDTRHITMVLNFFEEMSIAIQFGQGQEEMLRRFFKPRSPERLSVWPLDSSAASAATNRFSGVHNAR